MELVETFDSFIFFHHFIFFPARNCMHRKGTWTGNGNLGIGETQERMVWNGGQWETGNDMMVGLGTYLLGNVNLWEPALVYLGNG